MDQDEPADPVEAKIPESTPLWVDPPALPANLAEGLPTKGQELTYDDLELVEDTFRFVKFSRSARGSRIPTSSVDQGKMLNYRTAVRQAAAGGGTVTSSELKELLKPLQAMQKDMKSIQTDMKSLKTDVASLKTDVASLKTDVASLKTDVASLKTDRADYPRLIMALIKADRSKLHNRSADALTPYQPIYKTVPDLRQLPKSSPKPPSHLIGDTLPLSMEQPTPPWHLPSYPGAKTTAHNARLIACFFNEADFVIPDKATAAEATAILDDWMTGRV